MAVLRRGTWKGLKAVIPVGGQWDPISMLGERLEWKNAQKNEMKKKISEIINRIIPIFRPLITFFVWWPWKVASREISRHHWNIVNKIRIEAIMIKLLLLLWNNIIIPDVSIRALIEPVRGHGLFSTIWKGWNDIN